MKKMTPAKYYHFVTEADHAWKNILFYCIFILGRYPQELSLRKGSTWAHPKS